MSVTPDQAKMLASLVADIRPLGAPRWDPPGVVAAIKHVAHLSLADVARAAIAAAEDRTLKTPAAIGMPSSPCWRDKVLDERPTREPFDQSTFCGVCGEPRDRCERKWAGDHTFESVAHAKVRHARDETDVPRVVSALRELTVAEQDASEPNPESESA